MDDSVIIGIDLGTTNSEVAVFRDGKIELVSDENGSQMVPSVVGLDDESNLIVGIEARNQYVVHPERTIRSIKRKMGTDERVRLGDCEYQPQEISGMILRELKGRAEKVLGVAVNKAVITVPAFFSDAQRQATRDAGAIAGIEVARIINEPTAACLAYDLGEHESVRHVMAYDLGGGTFDVSIVRMEKDVVEVIGSHGDNELGGDDFDELLYGEVIRRLAQGPEAVPNFTDQALNRIRRAAETAKMRLSEEWSVKILEDNLELVQGDPVHIDMEIQRSEFEELIRDLIGRTVHSMHIALSKAKLKPADVSEVILVGGSTRIPMIAETIEQEVGRRPCRGLHPDFAVAYGAGVVAGRVMGVENQRILVDITPYTFGTSAVGIVKDELVPHKFVPIVHSGTPLPVSRSEAFTTVYDGQEAVECAVFQGEDSDARKNILVGKFRVDGLDTDAEAGNLILLHMQLDIDGILRVTATEKATGLSRNVCIENSMVALTPEAAEQSRRTIAALFGDTVAEKDGGENDCTPVHATVEADEDAAARELIDRVNKVRDDMDDVDREDAVRLIDDLKSSLHAENLEQAKRIITELEDLLFFVESN